MKTRHFSGKKKPFPEAGKNEIIYKDCKFYKFPNVPRKKKVNLFACQHKKYIKKKKIFERLSLSFYVEPTWKYSA